MRIISFTIVLVAAAAVAAAADFEENRRAWLEGPTSFLLAEAERGELARLTSNAELVAFERLFWARRDPDRATPESEAQVDFAARVEAADTKLGSSVLRGAMSDRGRVLLLVGAPSRHAVVPIANYLAELYGEPLPEHRGAAPGATVTAHGVTFDPAAGKAHVWAYRVDQLPLALRPAGAEPAAEIVFAFFDVAGSGDFRLQSGIRLADEAAQVLAAAPATFVLHPDLVTAPVPPAWPGATTASDAQLALLDGGALAWPDGASALVTRGVRGPGDLPLWVALVVPTALPAADAAVGRLRADDGTELGTFQVPATGRDGARGRSYELALPLPPTSGTLELALLAAGAPVVGRTLEVAANEADAGALVVAPVVAGAEVSAARQAAAGEPFVFGGYHLLPRPDGRYRADENLCLFFAVVAPGEVAPPATVRLRWAAGGASAPGAPPQPITLGQAGDGVWVWGTELPLATLAPGVDYTLTVKVEVGQDGVTRSTVVPVLVTGDEG